VSIIKVESGQFVMEDCKLYLKAQETRIIYPIPFMILSWACNTKISNCEILGTRLQPTIGILVLDSDLQVKDTVISEHPYGGIHLKSKADNIIQIKNCQIKMNGNCGIICIGREAEPEIRTCIISQNKGAGIRVSIHNKAKIIGCDILKNQQGVEIISSFPFVFNNNILNNYGNGVLTWTYQGFMCNGRITNNKISSNTQNGVMCTGKCNFTTIIANS